MTASPHRSSSVGSRSDLNVLTLCIAALVLSGGCSDLPEAPSDARAGLQDAGSDAAAPELTDATASPASDTGATLDASPEDARSAEDAFTFPALPSCLQDGELKAGKSSFSLERDGAQRAVHVYVPGNYDGTRPLPLIVDFHALGEGALLHEFVSNWDDMVNSEQVVVAMPQGIQDAWNLGPCCTESRAVDDVQFTRELVTRIAREGCIDTRRIYATGYSNGGGMVHKLGCAAADIFAAVAPAAFDLLEEIDCQPSRPISVYGFRGSADPIVGYDGGASTPPTLSYSLSEIHFLGARATFERWAMLDGCAGPPVAAGPGCQTYRSCAAGVEVQLCTKDGGGHDPSDATIAWPMLRAHTLP